MQSMLKSESVVDSDYMKSMLNYEKEEILDSIIGQAKCSLSYCCNSRWNLGTIIHLSKLYHHKY
jgi:hypothetical protein